MTKPPSGKSRNKVTPNPKGGRSSPVTTTSNSGTPLSHSSASSLSAGAAPVRSPIWLRSSNSTTNAGAAQEPWMETATPGKFQDFQEKIFPIVEYLTSKPEHVNHSFSKKWMVLKRTPNVPMTATITWRNLTILLGIRDMFQYREFLVQCPEFTKVVRFQNSKITRSGFDFGIDPTFHLPVFSPELMSTCL